MRVDTKFEKINKVQIELFQDDSFQKGAVMKFERWLKSDTKKIIMAVCHLLKTLRFMYKSK